MVESRNQYLALQRVLLTTAALTAALASGACAPAIAGYAARSAAADSVVRAAIARERSIQASDIPGNTVGVLPLTVISTDTAYASLGYGVAALMASDLARSSRLVVVERLRLDAVMRELELATSGRVDSVTAPRAGRIVGARRIVLGSLTIRTDALQMGSQVANATSGALDASLTGSSQLAQIFDAEKAMVFRLFEAMGIALTPAERSAIERRPTPSMAALMAFSNGVRAEFVKDFPRAIANYNTAVRLDPAFADASARASSINSQPASAAGATSSIARASGISTDLVNRPSPVQIGTGVDAPVTRQQLVTITITVSTP